MPEVALLYELSCPNVGEPRGNLLRAFSAAKLNATWREVDIDAPETPARVASIRLADGPYRPGRCERERAG